MDSKYEIKAVRLSELKPHPKNPRVHPDALITKLANSIREFGFTNPVLIDQDHRILAGHARCKAAEKMGLETVPAIILPLSGAAADAYVIVDNKLNELSSWDENLLCSLLTDLENGGFDLAMTGFDADEVDALFNAFYSKEAIEDDFDVHKEHAAIEAKGSVIQSGDIVLLGRHRLMCGDSTKAEDFAKLMEGRRAQAAVTSPPYGVGKDYEKKGIEPWFELIKPAIRNITKYADVVCWNLGDLYATGSQFIEPTTAHSIALFAEYGFRPIWIRIWKKQGQNFGVGPYHLVTNKPVQQYEYVTAFGSRAEPEYNDQEFAWVSAFAGHAYKFVKRLSKDERKKWGYSGIWEINTVKANNDHPAKFPVELPFRCIKMHSDTGGTVLEPFSGSGTTIIACEQTGRVCCAMEKEPSYAELAAKRYVEFVGKSDDVFVLRSGQRLTWEEMKN